MAERISMLDPNFDLTAEVEKGASALRDGKIIALPCFVCGLKAEAHHPNYDAPLDVIWLCPPHHKQTHALAKLCL